MRAPLYLVLAAMIASCVRPSLSTCNELACPFGKECRIALGVAVCATPSQIAACTGIADGTICDEGVCMGELCLAIVCGNGIVEPGETCDDGGQVAGDGCSPACRNESCGNGITDPGEGCDCGTPGTTPRPECSGKNNSDLDPAAPCRSSCTLRRCGDGTLEAPEQCEGSDLGGASCMAAGFYGGTLACTPFCTFDTTGCSGRCGDGVLQAEEVCDDTLFNLGCANFGFYGGEDRCSPFCQFDTSGCVGECGDGTIQTAFEACDGTNLNNQTCAAAGFYFGTLGCSAGCSFNTTGCVGRCGDGGINGPEVCDGINVPTTCAAYFDVTAPFTGQIYCSPFCTAFDPLQCHGCGDGQCETDLGETCANCPADCVIGAACCGNGNCETGEPNERLPGRCTCWADCASLCP